MTAVPQDPMFWKRFSTAVHQQEEQKPNPSGKEGKVPSRSDDPEKQGWLEQQQSTWKRQRVWVWISILALIVFAAAIVAALIWLGSHGFFLHGESVTFP